MISEWSGRRMSRSVVCVIGGGPAGITAAISAKRKGRNVVLLEKMARLGKKLLISGSGRCNLLNDELDASYYNTASEKLVRSVFDRFGLSEGEAQTRLDRFGKNDILDFFEGLGLKLYAENGRVFPITNQASSVLRALELELERLAIPVELNFDCIDIQASTPGFMVKSRDDKRFLCEKVVLTGGGKTYPAFGSDGSAYTLAKHLGHSIIEPVPSGVSLVVKDKLCHILQGQRICARVKGIIEGRTASEASGELLFTQYGLSGTAILDISDFLSIAINRDNKKDVWVECDLVPFMKADELAGRLGRGTSGLVGILPNKFEGPFKKASVVAKTNFFEDFFAAAIRVGKSL